MQNNIFFELLPLIAFFVIYYITKNLFIATAVCMVASWIQLILFKLKYKKVAKNIWLNTILITVFVGLTLILHNKTFIMLKPTVLFALIGISILIGQAAGKNGIKLLLAKEITVPDSLWNKINIAWGIFFIILGILNLVVALNFSEYFWVKFKVFGTTSLSILFLLICAIILIIQQKKAK
jgi:intracellular septation protein